MASQLPMSDYQNYSRFTIELRQVFLAMKVFQAKNVSFLFKMTILSPNMGTSSGVLGPKPHQNSKIL